MPARGAVRNIGILSKTVLFCFQWPSMQDEEVEISVQLLNVKAFFSASSQPKPFGCYCLFLFLVQENVSP